jgi:hypothetical protein
MYLTWRRGLTGHSYVRPRAYFEIDDHRFDKLPGVGEAGWNRPVLLARETEVPMTEIARN